MTGDRTDPGDAVLLCAPGWTGDRTAWLRHLVGPRNRSVARVVAWASVPARVRSEHARRAIRARWARRRVAA